MKPALLPSESHFIATRLYKVQNGSHSTAFPELLKEETSSITTNEESEINYR